MSPDAKFLGRIGVVDSGLTLSDYWSALVARGKKALVAEWEMRRFFLWLPVATGAGAVVALTAPTEPLLPAVLAAFVGLAMLAVMLRAHPLGRALTAAAAFVAGLAAADLRVARVAAPVLDRLIIGEIAGFVEEVDLRSQGARVVVRVREIEGLSPQQTPFRVRLSSRGPPGFAAGDFLVGRARLTPPPRASLPGGYDFARDAFFQRIGAVGAFLGAPEVVAPPDPPDWRLRYGAAIDRARNALALRAFAAIGGDYGAIAAAMVTGKRELLSDDARQIIARAGIFHVITISGVQMSLVAGLVFAALRRILMLVPHWAQSRPIKKWAAAGAIPAAIAYGQFTGSRVGSERALYMTVILLGAILCGRPAFSMRNLAFAAWIVALVEPEALLGASFQLSFAAVAALVAVFEARADVLPHHIGRDRGRRQTASGARKILEHGRRHLFGPLTASFCATSATASFMANDFHELSPYVLIGNPLTLAIIEIFAVPAALAAALLAPLGLDGWIWTYLGAGVKLIMAIAGVIAMAPGAKIALPQFAPFAIAALSLGVLSALIWRGLMMKLTALPFLALGFLGAANGEKFDLVIAPGGEIAALRDASGELALLGKRRDAFAMDSFLRADGDPRLVADMAAAGRCDRFGCAARLSDGRAVALTLDPEAFAEDCARADILATPLYAPKSCGAKWIFDRASLRETGAVALRLSGDQIFVRRARAAGEDRPWSPAPRAKYRPLPKNQAEIGFVGEAGE